MRLRNAISPIGLLVVGCNLVCGAHHRSPQAADRGSPGNSWDVGSGRHLGSTPAWTPSTFPNPDKDNEKCRSESRICDPDGVLTPDSLKDVEIEIASFEQANEIPCKIDGGHSAQLQLAVALVRKMDLSQYAQREDPESKAAEKFATTIHDDWGVGSVDCGGTGILLFVAIEDRTVFISVGSGVKSVLTNSRIDSSIDGMRPLLRKGEYRDAILGCIRSMGGHVERGKPSFQEKIGDFFRSFGGLLVFAGIMFAVTAKCYIERRQSQKYAEVHSCLSQLDRDHALALQGRYRCTTCPICFGDFEQTHHSSEAEDLIHSNASNEAEVVDVPSIGSDGLPLKLLRCGHVFDQTCWNDWVASGQGDVRKCPICQRDVGGSPPPSTHGEMQRNRREEREVDFERERNFRLMRLGRRYPRFVRPMDIQRWTRGDYNGPLSQDPSFVRNNPQRNSGTQRTEGWSGRPSGGFGGGRSSGGRGGRW